MLPYFTVNFLGSFSGHRWSDYRRLFKAQVLWLSLSTWSLKEVEKMKLLWKYEMGAFLWVDRTNGCEREREKWHTHRQKGEGEREVRCKREGDRNMRERLGRERQRYIAIWEKGKRELNIKIHKIGYKEREKLNWEKWTKQCI